MAYPTTTEHHKLYPYTSIMASPYSGDPTGTLDCAAAIELIKANQSNVGTIHIPTGIFKIGTNLTIPVGIRLYFEAGAYFSIADGVILTINGSVFGDEDHEVFTLVGTGLVVYSPSYNVNNIYKSSSFSSLTSAISFINSTPATLIIDKSASISADISLPATLAIQIEKGAVLTIATTKTLTINGALDAGLYQIFSCTGTGKVVFGVGKEVYPQWWGAKGDGTTNDAVAIQAALTAGKKVVFPPTTYKCNAGLTWNIDDVTIDLCGSTIDFSAMTTGISLGPTVVTADVNERVALINAHPVSNGTFVGPGVAETDVTCLNINESTDDSIAGGNFRNCTFLDFAKDINFGDGAFMWNFDNCIFTITAGAPSTYSLNVLAAATNAGENNAFTNCKWFNRPYVLNQTNGSAQTIFNQCSIDYCKRAITLVDGVVRINGGSIEDNDDTDYWFHVDGERPDLKLVNVDIGFMADKTAFSPFYTTADIEHGIWLENIGIGTGSISTMSVDLVAGGGGVHARWLQYGKDAVKPMIGSSASQLADGGFEAATAINEWDITGSTGATPPTISAAQAHGGTKSLLLTGTSTNNPKAKLLISVLPGQHPTGSFWYMASALTGSEGTLYLTLSYVDRGGTDVGWGDVITVTADAVWTKSFDITAYNCAPPGATHYRIEFELDGVTTGTALVYLDDIIVNIN